MQAALKGMKNIPSIESLLGSDFAEKVVIFTKEQDKKLLDYTMKRIEKQRLQNGQ